MPAAAASQDSQFTFLISCIRHSNNGKVNFEEVAKECQIVTKAAAAKRYERMMKAHGIHQSQAPAGRDNGVEPMKPKAKSSTDEEPPLAKKRKRSATTKAKAVKEEEVLDEAEQDAASEDASRVKEEPVDDQEYDSADHRADFEVEPLR